MPGLGIMGCAMARNLIKSGKFAKVVVWNRTLSKVGLHNHTQKQAPRRDSIIRRRLRSLEVPAAGFCLVGVCMP